MRERQGPLHAQADEQVEHHVEAFRGASPLAPPVIAITDDDDEWPPRWQRAVAWRVRERVPGVRIVSDPADEGE